MPVRKKSTHLYLYTIIMRRRSIHSENKLDLQKAMEEKPDTPEKCHDNSTDLNKSCDTSDAHERSLHGSSATRDPADIPYNPECNSEREPQCEKTNWLIYIKFVAIIILPIAIYLTPSAPRSVEKKCTYEKLINDYPQQDPKMWRRVSIAVENILNKRSSAPLVQLFVHQGDSGMESLVRKIAKETSDCFGENSHLVEMTMDDFTSAKVVEDYGHIVEAFKTKIKNGKVVVIVDLNKIPPKAARALHTICDVHTPIAKEEFAIFLTLVTPANGNPVANAENTLDHLWGTKLERNELDPLKTRVTDDVIALKPLN
ncbi:uncharacterized protein TORIP [Eurosta solidaginis]|uniref:uncharacterized protein TORIP n=1 Tax=Eurosta solidaginis TaxID=178769 RepID=UPI003530AE7A